ncbi:CpaE family protein [Specibacter sp. NPDC057265]|uniref:AAA family ATPase n=1 Tax=Specibacter sp. NPDC057265 TaxID=3346075 RepID=UPI00363AD5B3
MSQFRVVSVGDTPTGVIAGMAAQDGPVRIVRRCSELTELLAACQSGIAQAAVIATPAQQLTATLIDRLRAVGVCVIAVSATAEQTRRLYSIGATPFPEDAGAALLTQSILAALDARRHSPSTGFAVPAAPDELDEGEASSGAASGEQAASAPGAAQRSGAQAPSPAPPGSVSMGKAAGFQPDAGPQTAAAAPGKRRSSWFAPRRRGKVRLPGAVLPASPPATAPGTLVAVWGPIGSPGRTTVAMNLAAEYATQGRQVLLIDADSYGASIAAALGLLDESASFAQACRAADQGTLSVAALAKTSTGVVFTGGTFSLLTGLTRPDRWPELRAAAVERVLATARDLAELVIVDCGFSLESDEELSYDTVAPRRNAATLSVLEQADVILAVGSGDAIGIPRLIRALAELDRLPHHGQVRVVVNKVRRKAVGAGPEKALEQAWQRFGPNIAISHFLPWDPELTDKALLSGRLLLEVAADSGLRRAICAMSCADDQRKIDIAGSRSTASPPVPG